MDVSSLLQACALPNPEAEILLAYATDRERTWLFAHPEAAVTLKCTQLFRACARRRERGEPIAYITGTKEFYGRVFSVDRRVLIPRPATEGLIELAKDFLAGGKEEIREADAGIVAVAKKFGAMEGLRTVVDVGTGSGCIAVTLKLEMPALHVIATDNSRGALAKAGENARRLGADIDVRCGRFLEPVGRMAEPFVVVANPPYLAKPPEDGRRPGADVPDGLRYEPAGALFADEDGAVALRTIYTQASRNPSCRGIVLECPASLLGLLTEQ